MKESEGKSKSKSAMEKERLKLRERQRRSITTKILNGLRKHGGYDLAPRADINDVLTELVKEAGWIVEPDGTTYRAKVQPRHQCAACIVGMSNRVTTQTSSLNGGDCSTIASPRYVPLQQHQSTSSGEMRPTSHYYFCSCGTTSTSRNPTPDGELQQCGSLPLRSDDLAAYFVSLIHNQHYLSMGSHSSAGPVHQQLAFFQEARASNQNTPIGSPQRLG